MSFGYYGWAPRPSAAERRAAADRHLAEAARRGKPLSPVAVQGRKIAHTYWGSAWCDNLERYRDFAHRLERGRTYVRGGSVIHLQIAAGKVVAKVYGSELYDVEITVDTVASKAWQALQRDCAGSIGSRVDLLAGELSAAVMARLCADGTGLFPAPAAIRFRCSCPDHATMCKHVAAAMYGVGARLDREPELLFTLRRVSLDDLVAAAIATRAVAAPKAGRVLAATGLAAMFGIEMAEAGAGGEGGAELAPRKQVAKAVTKVISAGVAKARGRSAGSAKAGVVKAGVVKAGVAKAGVAKAGVAKTRVAQAGVAKAGVASKPVSKRAAKAVVPARAAKAAAPAHAAKVTRARAAGPLRASK